MKYLILLALVFSVAGCVKVVKDKKGAPPAEEKTRLVVVQEEYTPGWAFSTRLVIVRDTLTGIEFLIGRCANGGIAISRMK